MRTKLVWAAVVLLFALSAHALPAAVAKRGTVEVDHTLIGVSEQDLENNVEEFVIEIAHIEDDVDDTDGHVKGERTGLVALKVDVTPAGVVTVNGEAVQAGINEVAVMARFTSVGEQQDFKPISAVRVQVFVGFASLVDAQTNAAYTAVRIQVRVLEVEGDKVWQADVMEQMVEVRADGTVTKNAVVRIEESMSMLPPVAPPTDDDDEMEHKNDEDEKEEKKPKHPHHHGKNKDGDRPRPPHKHGHPRPQSSDNGVPLTLVDPVPEPNDDFWHNVRRTLHHWKCVAFEWYHSLPFFLRVVIAFAFGMVAGFVVLGIASCFARMCCGSKKCSKSCGSKKCSKSYDQNLRTFAGEYTALPQDEKSAKKEKESGSAEMV